MRKCPACGYANYNPAAVACEMCYAKLDKGAGGDEAPKGKAAAQGKADADMEALAEAAAGEAPAAAGKRAAGKPAAAGRPAAAGKPGSKGEEVTAPVDSLLFALALPVTFPIAAWVGLRTRDWAGVPPSAWVAQALLFLGLTLGATLSLGEGRPPWLPGVLLILVVAAMAGAGLLVRIGEAAIGWASLGLLAATSCITVGTTLLLSGATALEHPTRVLALAYRGDAKAKASVALSAAEDGVRLWDVARGDVLRQLEGKGRSLSAVALGPTLAAAGAEDGIVNLWTAADGAVAGRLEAGKGGVLCLALTEAGGEPRLAAGTLDGQVWLWGVREGRRQRGPGGHQGPVTALAWSPDGSLLASGGADKRAVVWRADGGRERAFRGHEGAVLAAAIAPDGKALVTGSDDGKARVWDLTSEEDKPKPVVLPVGGPVRWVAFVAGGRVVTGQDGRELALWDPVKGLPLGRLELPSAPSAVVGAGDTLLVALGRSVRVVEVSRFKAP